MAGLDPRTFPLLMISAMYENGGNTTQRLLDGHPELFVYPFESQIGTRAVQDHLTSMYPVKYRWPEFLLSATLAADYGAIIDEEGKVRARTPSVSKFREYPMDFSDEDRKARFLKLMEGVPRSRAAIVAAFFMASFEAWKDYRRSGREHVYVGYSPIVAVDAEKILEDLPNGCVLQVVRNPWSAFGDTLKRAVPLSLAHYMTAWSVCQEAALAAQAVHPDRMHIVRFEDIVEDPEGVLGKVCRAVGVGVGPSLAQPSWNGTPLKEVYPWGTIRTPTRAANLATAKELDREQTDAIRRRTGHLLERFGYESFGD
ncbi:MAG: sulfotransferase [Candidatus Dormibacteraeota bacterium]|nr:sulfotransferase [Candidatus Dormibacteraeota bacterium]